MGEVVIAPFITTLDCEPNRVLNAAIDKVDSAVVIGWGKDEEFYFASSIGGGPEVLWLLQLAIKNLMNAGDAE